MQETFDEQLNAILADTTSGSTQLLGQLQKALIQTGTLNREQLTNLIEASLSRFPDCLVLHHFLNTLWESQGQQPLKQVVREYQNNWEPTGKIMAKQFDPICEAGPLLFHSQSSALIDLGYSLNKRPQPPAIFQTISRPGEEGLLQAQTLKEMGLRVELVEDLAAAMVKNQIKTIVVGADLLHEEGFKNKTGTYWLALLAHQYQIPFYVIADSRKKLPSEYPQSWQNEFLSKPSSKATWHGPNADQKPLPYWNQTFEWTPISLVDTFITEKGLITPANFQSLSAFNPSPQWVSFLENMNKTSP